MESQTMRHMIEDDCADNGIPLPNVNSKILSKVIEYCNKHVLKNVNSKAGSDDAGATAANSTAASGEDLKNWDANFVMVDQATLFDLILDLPDDVRIAQQKKLEELKRQQELQNQLAVQRTVQQELQIEELWDWS